MRFKPGMNLLAAWKSDEAVASNYWEELTPKAVMLCFKLDGNHTPLFHFALLSCTKTPRKTCQHSWSDFHRNCSTPWVCITFSCIAALLSFAKFVKIIARTGLFCLKTVAVCEVGKCTEGSGLWGATELKLLQFFFPVTVVSSGD